MSPVTRDHRQALKNTARSLQRSSSTVLTALECADGGANQVSLLLSVEGDLKLSLRLLEKARKALVAEREKLV